MFCFQKFAQVLDFRTVSLLDGYSAELYTDNCPSVESRRAGRKDEQRVESRNSCRIGTLPIPVPRCPRHCRLPSYSPPFRSSSPSDDCV